MEREALFEQLYRKYYTRTRAFLVRMGFDLADAQEMAQEVFVRVYRSFDMYREGSDWAYIQTVARRLAANHLRDRAAQKREGIVSPLDEVYEMQDYEKAPDLAFAHKERSQRLAAAIDSLSPNLRATIMLYLSEHSYDEMAKILGISLSALKSRLNAARTALRSALGDSESDET